MCGVLLRVPLFGGGTQYSSGRYEDEETDLVLRLAAAAHIRWFCDVGAHIGYYSLVVDRGMDGECTIYAFEPTTEAFSCLASNLAHNCMGRFHVYKEAVAEGAGVQPFAGEGGHVASGLEAYRPKTYGNRGKREQSVRVVSLDEVLLLQGATGPGIVKIDVEGAEAAVLDGAAMLITQNRPLWIIECHGEEMQRAVLERMLRADYSCYSIPQRVAQVAFPHLVAIADEQQGVLSELCAELMASGRLAKATQT